VRSTPFWKGVHNLKAKAVGCGIWSCTELIRDFVSTIGMSAMLFLLGIAVVLPIALNSYRWSAQLFPTQRRPALEEQQYDPASLHDAYERLDASHRGIRWRPTAPSTPVPAVKLWSANDRMSPVVGEKLRVIGMHSDGRWVVDD
jgi:hypothetical protein